MSRCCRAGGSNRADDRRVISGIVHMLRPGARWRDCPPGYGPYTTVYNRFTVGADRASGSACSRRRPTIAAPGGRPPSTPRTSRRTAQRPGLRPSYRHLAWRPHNRTARTDRRAGSPPRAATLGGQHHRHDDGRVADRCHRTVPRLLADKGYDTNAIRAAMVQAQRLATHRNALRQARRQLPQFGAHRRRIHPWVQSSREPRP